ncbi:hypothetical protein LCGC14_1777740, partial [marine sediment metagenome]
MDFCIISPVTGLSRYSTLSKTHLVLPHIYDEDYWNFYEDRRAEGDRIILDNGAYEGREFHEIRFTSLLRYLKPQVAVLPDYPLQPWEKTWHAAITFLDRWAEKFPDVEWMYVPQAEKGMQSTWSSSLYTVKGEPRITWIGLPRAMITHVFSSPLARAEMAYQIRGWSSPLKVHCLGMDAGNVHELYYLNKAGVTSIDSSAPVWRGWQGYKLNEESIWFGKGEPKEWPDYPIDFDAPLDNTSLGPKGVSQELKHQ